MKTTTHLLVLFLSFISFQINAQFTLGVKGGYIKAWQDYGDAALPDDAKIHVSGYQVSGLFYFEFLKNVSIGIEPGYAQRGAACVPDFIVFNMDKRLLLNYIELPLMASINLPVFNNQFEIMGKAGFGASKIVKAYQETKTLGSDEPFERTEIDLDPTFGTNLNVWDNGFYGGLGLAYKLHDNRLFFEMNYYHGLKDVDTLNTSKNRSLHYGLGYLIRL